MLAPQPAQQAPQHDPQLGGQRVQFEVARQAASVSSASVSTG